MTNIKLNKRLERIAFQVEKNSKMLDVGCDHALLDIYLTFENKNITAVASDINKNPLEKARENIEKYNLLDKIEIRLGPGIETIDEKVDTVIISGMGGLTIIDILESKKELLKNVSTLILSPNNYFEEVRKKVTKLGYFIENEEMVSENKHFYPVIVLKKGKKRYKRIEYKYGPVLIKNRPKEFMEYLEIERSNKKVLLEKLPKKCWRRILQTKWELYFLNNSLNKFD